MRATQFAWHALRLGAPIYAILEGYWWYGLLLALAALAKPQRVRGYIIICHLLDMTAVIVGIALGLCKLAVLGVVVPELLILMMAAHFGPRLGVRERRRLFRIDWPPRTPEQKQHETRQNMMQLWSKRLRAAPTDRATIEQVLLDMRSWRMTAEQASTLARRDATPTALAQKSSWKHRFRGHPRTHRATDAGAQLGKTRSMRLNLHFNVATSPTLPTDRCIEPSGSHLPSTHRPETERLR